ncbi:TetR/AcrR family transcriptional regulator [Gaetbulibacter sp. M235]|uniref:TetR/AcrR family transcriptional regulator n=1 Tax=Gaetbulibacter sp. M235 TaxID=3126510 RepID=UPI00374E68B8
MRPQKILHKEIVKGLAKVFRSKGHEAASLIELSEVTGLKRTCLYHSFPNGKQEMAESVLNHIAKWVQENVFSTLNNENLSPEVRLKNGLLQIRTLYNGGREACVFRAFSMQTGCTFSNKILKMVLMSGLITLQR